MSISKSMRMRSALAALAATAFAVPAVAETSQAVIAFPAQPPHLDPHVTTTSVTNQVSRHVFESLVTQDAAFNIQPALAKEWEVSEDGLTYTFRLREGVQFHDGSPLTAEDVVASMNRWGRLSAPGRAALTDPVWTVVDNNTVTLEVSAASFLIPYAIASGGTQNAAIMKASVLEAAGDEPIQEVIGTGPYQFDSWVPDQMIELSRYEGYTPFEGERSGLAGDRTPYINNLQIAFVQDETTRSFGLQTGQYDIVMDVPYDGAEQIIADESLNTESYPWKILNVIFNKADGLFTDVRARYAINMALDRRAILQSAAGNEEFFNLTHHQMLVSQEDLWNTDVGREGFDMPRTEEARALLEEIGYNGEELVIITSRDYIEMYNAAVVVQQQLANIGVNARIENYDWPTLSEVRMRRDAYDMLVLSNTYKLEPSMLTHFNPQFPGFTDDPNLSDLLARFRSASTIEEAAEQYDILQQWYEDYMPAAKIGDVHVIIGIGPRVAELPLLEGPVYWGARLTD